MGLLKSLLAVGFLLINTNGLFAEDDFGKQLAENEKQFEEFLESVGNIGNTVAKQEYGIDLKAEIQAPQENKAEKTTVEKKPSEEKSKVASAQYDYEKESEQFGNFLLGLQSHLLGTAKAGTNVLTKIAEKNMKDKEVVAEPNKLAKSEEIDGQSKAQLANDANVKTSSEARAIAVQASIHSDKGEFAEAARLYSKALNMDNRFHEAAYNLASEYAKSNNVEAALASLRYAILLNEQYKVKAKSDKNFQLLNENKQFLEMLE